MKEILIIVVTFVVAFATTIVLDWSFVATNNIRYGLVVLLIVIELIIGFNAVKSTVIKNLKNER